MPEKTELTPQQVEAIYGGTSHECAELAFELASHGYGVFLKYHPERGDAVDDEAIVDFFAKKGYKFVPAFGDEEQNLFYGPDGMVYGNDYIVNLIKTGQL